MFYRGMYVVLTKTAGFDEAKGDFSVDTNLKKFESDLNPGDIILTKPNKNMAGFVDKVWQGVSKLMTGSEWTHAGLYVGNGKILHSYEGLTPWGRWSNKDSKKKVRIHSLRNMKRLGRDMLALRPKVSKDERQNAVNTGKALLGTPYSNAKLLRAAVSSGGSRDEDPNVPDSAICTGILGHIYKNIDFRPGKSKELLRPVDFISSGKTIPVGGFISSGKTANVHPSLLGEKNKNQSHERRMGIAPPWTKVPLLASLAGESYLAGSTIIHDKLLPKNKLLQDIERIKARAPDTVTFKRYDDKLINSILGGKYRTGEQGIKLDGIFYPSTATITHGDHPVVVAHEIGHSLDPWSNDIRLHEAKNPISRYLWKLRAEAGANIEAFKLLKDEFGMGRALRSTPLLASSFLSHLAPAAISLLGAGILYGLVSNHYKKPKTIGG